MQWKFLKNGAFPNKMRRRCTNVLLALIPAALTQQGRKLVLQHCLNLGIQYFRAISVCFTNQWFQPAHSSCCDATCRPPGTGVSYRKVFLCRSITFHIFPNETVDHTPPLLRMTAQFGGGLIYLIYFAVRPQKKWAIPYVRFFTDRIIFSSNCLSSISSCQKVFFNEKIVRQI